MFILGALVGIFFLAGLMGCSVVRPVWDGAKDLTGKAVGAVEGGVEATYDVVTSPLDAITGDDEEEVVVEEVAEEAVEEAAE